MPLFLLFNTINKNKPSANREKSASNNKKGELEDKPIANEEELTNDNYRDSNNKPSTNMKSLVREKNINQDSNAGIHKQEKAKMVSIKIRKAVLSNLCLCEHANSKSKVFVDVFDLQQLKERQLDK